MIDLSCDILKFADSIQIDQRWCKSMPLLTHVEVGAHVLQVLPGHALYMLGVQLQELVIPAVRYSDFKRHKTEQDELDVEKLTRLARAYPNLNRLAF